MLMWRGWLWYQSPKRYAAGQGPRALRARYWCPPHCVPAREASRYDDLPWSALVSLSAAPGGFLTSWCGWVNGGHADVLWRYPDGYPWYQPFYLLVIAWQPGTGEPHAHLLVGNVSVAQVREAVEAWDGSREVKKVFNRWGALHYCFAQTKDRAAHHRDVNSYCHELCAPPFESLNLEAVYLLTRQRIRRAIVRRALRWRSKTWRTDRARTAARARWAARGATP